jgi:hypothetical protein
MQKLADSNFELTESARPCHHISIAPLAIPPMEVSSYLTGNMAYDGCTLRETGILSLKHKSVTE